jgi:hypothetical protein
MTPAHVAAPPDVLRWTSRSGDHGDCVVAALELACGVSYEEALQAATKAAPNILTEGMWLTEIPKAARRLGHRVRKLRAGTFDLDESTGILHVYQSHRPLRETSHVVYLWDGRIVEPKFDRRQLWRHPQQFLKHYGYKAGSLLVIADDE